MDAASLIPTGGGAVAILIVSMIIGIICGVVGIEMHHNVFGWMISGFVTSLIVISAIHAWA